jgi:splicing factor 4
MDQFIPEHERVRMMAVAGDPASRAAIEAKQAIEARLHGGGGGGGGAGGLGYNPLERKGLGASDPTAPSSQDDIYEQYKKRMSTGYRYRPNPLGNPRKQYY